MRAWRITAVRRRMAVQTWAANARGARGCPILATCDVAQPGDQGHDRHGRRHRHRRRRPGRKLGVPSRCPRGERHRGGAGEHCGRRHRPLERSRPGLLRPARRSEARVDLAGMVPGVGRAGRRRVRLHADRVPLDRAERACRARSSQHRVASGDGRGLQRHRRRYSIGAWPRHSRSRTRWPHGSPSPGTRIPR